MARDPFLLRKFDPFQMTADLVRRLAVGRDEILKTLLTFVEENLRGGGPPQHLCLVAPRGSGKTFLLRLLGLALDERRSAGEPVLFLHLPEEMPHVLSPLAFLREIRRRLTGEGPEANAPKKREEIGLWDALRDDIDRRLGERFGEKRGLLVLCVENIKDVLKQAFPDEPARRKLRAWLERTDGRIMLIAGSSAGRFDQDADKALFAIVRNLELRPWSADETIEFLDRFLVARDGRGLAKAEERVARAIVVFTGGNPRLAAAMAEVLRAEDALSAAETLDALVDNLQEYYLHRLRDLTPEEKRCVAALLTEGENASQTEVGRRLGVEQSVVAQAFRKLEYDDGFLLGDRLAGAKEKLYRVADRVFVHFYNVRVLYHGEERGVLAPILDFLVSAFSDLERADQAERLMARGLPREAATLMGTLTEMTPAVLDCKWWTGIRNFVEWVAEELPDRRPDASRLVAALGALVRDPSTETAAILQEAPADLADLAAALDHLAKGRYREARRDAGRTIAEAPNDWLKGVAWLAKVYSGFLVGEREEQESGARKVEEIARELGDPDLLSYALSCFRYLRDVDGDWQAVEHHAREISELAVPDKWAHNCANAIRRIAVSARLRGEFARAESEARRALEMAEATGRSTSIGRAEQELANILIETNRAEQALPLAESAVERARRAGEFDNCCDAFQTLSNAQNLLGRAGDAIDASRRGLAALPARAGPYLRARAEADLAWRLTARDASRSDAADAEAEALAESVLAALDDVPDFAPWRSEALEAKLAVAKRAHDPRRALDIARRLAPAAKVAGRADVFAWALAEAVDALWRLKAYDEAVAEAVAALKALLKISDYDVRTNRSFIVGRLVDALRSLGRLPKARSIAAEIGAAASSPRDAWALAETSLPIAEASGDYEFGVDLFEDAYRGGGAPPEPTMGAVGPVALACVAGARAWERAEAFVGEGFWTDVLNHLAGGRIAEVVASTEATRDRAAAYSVFRAAWDYLQGHAAAESRTEILPQLLTHYRVKDLSGELLADIASTLEAERAFDAEARMLRELSAFNAAKNRPNALARLDPDLAAALRAVDPALESPPAKGAPAKRPRSAARKPKRRK